MRNHERDTTNHFTLAAGILIAWAVCIMPFIMWAYEAQQAMEDCRATTSFETCAAALWR